jgi:hypothetical protein
VTRKDYIAIAKCIQAQRSRGLEANIALDALAEDLAVYLAADNPRFDQDIFFDACGNA